MNIELGTIKSSPFVGVFSIITEKMALFPRFLEKKEKKMVEKMFGTETIYTGLANSSLLGVLAAGNSKGFVVSGIVEDKEVEELQEQGLNVKRLQGTTALGNLMECNDKKAFCSKAIGKKDVQEIKKVLKVECIETQIAGSDLVGSCLVLTNKGFVANPETTDKEFKAIEKETGLEGTTATANYGDKFVGNNLVANSSNALAGLHTSGHELMRIDEGLRGE